MKKAIIFLAIFFLLFQSMVSAGASDKINVKINNKNYTVITVPIMVNNQELSSLVPSFLLGDRTLVPLRFIGEHYGMKVDWENATQKVKISGGGLDIVLQINSPDVVVKSENKVLDENSIPRLTIFPDGDARTMVPLRFISEVLNYKVDWDEKNLTAHISKFNNTEENLIDNVNNGAVVTNPDSAFNELNGMDYSASETGETIICNTSKEITYSEKYYEDIKTLDIILPNTRDGVYAKEFYNKYLANPNSKIYGWEIRKSKDNPDDLLIKITFKEDTAYTLKNDKSLLIININGGSNVINTKLETPPGETVVRDVVEFDGGFKVIGAGGAKYNILTLDNPKRYIVDIMDAFFNGIESKTYDYNKGYVNQVRASQFSPDKNYKPTDKIVRLVFDIQDGVNPNMKVASDGNDLIITPEDSIWNLIKIDGDIFKANLKKEVAYTTEFQPENKKFIIHMPLDATDIKDEKVVTGGLIYSVALETSGYERTLSLEFKRSVNCQVLSPPNSSEISVRTEKIFTGTPSDYLIWIDAGHGGRDPGTSGVNTKTPEKAVNLPVALKTRDILLNMGYQVMMTRTDDTYVGTYQRPELANAAQADVFVSIHANNIDKHSVNGIEAFYYQPNEVETNRADQKYLMQYVYEEASKRTGIKKRMTDNKRPYIVIKYAKMPAMLIEMAYMSNAQDEQKLINPAVQTQFAEAIAYGIDRYIRDFK